MPPGPRAPGKLEITIKEGLRARAPEASGPVAALVITLLGALSADVSFHDGVGGFGVILFTVVLAAGLAGRRIVVRRQGIILLATAIVLAGIWEARASPWIRLPVALSLGGCMLGAALFGRQGDLFDLSWFGLLRSPSAVSAHGWLTPRWLVRSVTGRVRVPGALSLPVLGRALVIAVPLLGVLIALLVSADPLFGTVIRDWFDPKTIMSQILTLLWGAGLVAVLARTALCEPERPRAAPGRRHLGTAETQLVLAGMGLVFTAFVAIQVASTLGFGRRTLERRGITYASYARSGYFQLLWVVAITAVVLTALDAAGGSSKRRPAERFLPLLIVALTLAVEATAVRRLFLYDNAYGLTMLRLACLFGAAFMAVLLVLVGVWVGGVHRHRRWLPGSVATALVITVIAFGVLNPEQLVVNYDVAHRQSVHLDIEYLSKLSDDAVPALVSDLPRLSPADASTLRDALCKRPRRVAGWAQQTLASTRADQKLAMLC